ncbi:hypothetical protein GCM10010400_76140 [Streptomyces aculeolatus]|uniref:hypothetical protein n=1 Tax=Streptomyces aculeolatus TaxID=270689 RepID=UPI001CEC7ECF|nr:hypothetical protein [Streptomyces aculeolatus]
MSAHAPSPNCDCGACCSACGHDAGCSVFEPQPEPLSMTELKARADARPDSLLASLMSDVDRDHARYIDILGGHS